jgi:GH18 family chitinase
MFLANTFFRRRAGPDPAIDSHASNQVPLYTNAAYYPNWRIYRKEPPSSLRLGFISHVYYAFAWYVQSIAGLSASPANLELASCRVQEDGTVYV